MPPSGWSATTLVAASPEDWSSEPFQILSSSCLKRFYVLLFGSKSKECRYATKLFGSPKIRRKNQNKVTEHIYFSIAVRLKLNSMIFHTESTLNSQFCIVFRKVPPHQISFVSFLTALPASYCQGVECSHDWCLPTTPHVAGIST